MQGVLHVRMCAQGGSLEKGACSLRGCLGAGMSGKEWWSNRPERNSEDPAPLIPCRCCLAAASASHSLPVFYHNSTRQMCPFLSFCGR